MRRRAAFQAGVVTHTALCEPSSRWASLRCNFAEPGIGRVVQHALAGQGQLCGTKLPLSLQVRTAALLHCGLLSSTSNQSKLRLGNNSHALHRNLICLPYLVQKFSGNTVIEEDRFLTINLRTHQKPKAGVRKVHRHAMPPSRQ